MISLFINHSFHLRREDCSKSLGVCYVKLGVFPFVIDHLPPTTDIDSCVQSLMSHGRKKAKDPYFAVIVSRKYCFPVGTFIFIFLSSKVCYSDVP